jgi:hypothetical protein
VRQKVKWAKIVENLIEENYPEAKISKRGAKDHLALQNNL